MPIQIDFELNRDDFVAFYLRSGERSGQWRQAARVGQWVGVLCIVCLGSFFSALMMYQSSGGVPWWMGLVFAGILSPLWFATWPREYQQAHRKALEQAVVRSIGDSALGHYQLVLGPEKVAAIGPGREISMAWHTIQSVEHNEKYVYLMMGPASAFIVPKQAFPDVDALERFLAEAKSKMEASRSPQPALLGTG